MWGTAGVALRVLSLGEGFKLLFRLKTLSAEEFK